MILVTASVGAILPIVGVIVGGETHTDMQFFLQIKKLIGVSDQRALLTVLVVGFCILITLKVSVSLWVLVEQKKLNAEMKYRAPYKSKCGKIAEINSAPVFSSFPSLQPIA